MHIVDVAEFYAPTGGGVRTYIDAKIARAAATGARITVIAPGPCDHVEQRDGGRIITVRSPTIPIDRRYHLFGRATPVHQMLDLLAPDVVEASSPFRAASIVANWQGPVAARAAKALFMHADPVAAHPQLWLSPAVSPAMVDRVFGWFWRYLKRTADRFDAVVAGSRWFAARLRDQAGILAEIVPLGVDLDLFHPGRRDPALRARLLAGLGIGPQGKLLVGVGRHHPEKQWPMLFSAVGALASDGVGMVQIGEGFSGRSVARAAARAGNVGLLGRIDDRAHLAAMLASSDIFVHGSSAETFGLVVSEGLAAGLPLVLPSTGGATDVADPAWSELYTSGDSEGATNAIRRLLRRDAHALRAAAARARQTRVFDPQQHFEQLFSLYAGACRSGTGRQTLIAA